MSEAKAGTCKAAESDTKTSGGVVSKQKGTVSKFHLQTRGTIDILHCIVRKLRSEFIPHPGLES